MSPVERKGGPVTAADKAIEARNQLLQTAAMLLADVHTSRWESDVRELLAAIGRLPAWRGEVPHG